MKELKLLACKDMTLSFSATTINEDENLLSIEVDVKYDVVTEPDSRIRTGNGRGFYFGDVSLQASIISCIVKGVTYIYSGDPVDFILNPSAKHVSRIQDGGKALLNGDSSRPVDVTLTTSVPTSPPIPSSVTISITAKVDDPGQSSVRGI